MLHETARYWNKWRPLIFSPRSLRKLRPQPVCVLAARLWLRVIRLSSWTILGGMLRNCQTEQSLKFVCRPELHESLICTS
jgi:hypothetical protein